MPQRERPARARRGPSDVRSWETKRPEGSSNPQRKPPATARLTAAICGALAEIPPEDRGEVARWAAGRLMLAVVHEHGFRRAPRDAYRMADVLAVAA